jgi:hypothetical protein
LDSSILLSIASTLWVNVRRYWIEIYIISGDIKKELVSIMLGSKGGKMSSRSGSQYVGHPNLVRFTGEVTEVRLNPETHVSGYAGGTSGGSMSSWITTVGAITVRVMGKPITCLIDMRSRNIGIMPGNNVTIWGRARVWKSGSDLPESVDVRRMTCEETGEVHPSGAEAFGAVFLIPIIFCLVFGVIFVFLFLGPFSMMGGFGFFTPFIFLPLIFGVFFIIIIITFVVLAANRRTTVGPLEGYAEVGQAIRAEEAPSSSKKCIVCNLAISKADDVVSCPHCGNRAHREHMLEWLHTHDYCPVCEKHLREQDF